MRPREVSEQTIARNAGQRKPFSPSPSGEGLGWGRKGHPVSARPPPPPTPPLKGRGAFVDVTS
ncbi:hypothetical protein EAH76_22860 [Sphingomonas glacialis]|uniref:Uncharacterized protein n=1 Tax=Sphingomonas glacialis TaxID=658225 RepID=A0A502FCH7_9SPHN|nr:hypothetical protein EAH76_22860 [Sphingomonas glacialis]